MILPFAKLAFYKLVRREGISPLTGAVYLFKKSKTSFQFLMKSFSNPSREQSSLLALDET
jgi:hypothetical protein